MILLPSFRCPPLLVQLYPLLLLSQTLLAMLVLLFSRSDTICLYIHSRSLFVDHQLACIDTMIWSHLPRTSHIYSTCAIYVYQSRGHHATCFSIHHPLPFLVFHAVLCGLSICVHGFYAVFLAHHGVVV